MKVPCFIHGIKRGGFCENTSKDMRTFIFLINSILSKMNGMHAINA